MLGAVGLSGAAATTQVSALSGGQKARLAFAIINCEQPDVLCLDEPCNHLDLLTIEALIEALAEYRGAVVVVSHDEYVMRECDEFWGISNGSLVRIDE
jgi:ATPase subunit of ABC transporter with duplicated ATPase domains